jgi:hypothetical protein
MINVAADVRRLYSDRMLAERRNMEPPHVGCYEARIPLRARMLAGQRAFAKNDADETDL